MKTTDQERDLLRRHGFVRVDGLVGQWPGAGLATYIIGTEPHCAGIWDHSDGSAVLVASGLEIWVCFDSGKMPDEVIRALSLRWSNFGCPDIFEYISARDIENRMKDPDWVPTS